MQRLQAYIRRGQERSVERVDKGLAASSAWTQLKTELPNQGPTSIREPDWQTNTRIQYTHRRSVGSVAHSLLPTPSARDSGLSEHLSVGKRRMLLRPSSDAPSYQAIRRRLYNVEHGSSRKSRVPVANPMRAPMQTRNQHDDCLTQEPELQSLFATVL